MEYFPEQPHSGSTTNTQCNGTNHNTHDTNDNGLWRPGVLRSMGSRSPARSNINVSLSRSKIHPDTDS